MFLLWRWVFPSRWPSARPSFDSAVIRRFAAEMFALVFPDACHVCAVPLRSLSRVPVCESCLSEPKPFLAEYFCAGCQTPFLNPAPLDADGLCGLCRRGLTGFDAAFSYGEYEGTLRKLIHVFKYEGVAPLASRLGGLLSRAVPREAGFDVIVPMPLHWVRRWRRGFNQSELLASELSRRTGVPLARALRRKRATQSQAGLTRAERRQNVAGAFDISRRAGVHGKHVLLIDDVLTTGASASACAAVLKRSGARRVSVLTLARVDRRKGFVGLAAGSA
jgi:ComF family protein